MLRDSCRYVGWIAILCVLCPSFAAAQPLDSSSSKFRSDMERRLRDSRQRAEEVRRRLDASHGKLPGHEVIDQHRRQVDREIAATRQRMELARRYDYRLEVGRMIGYVFRLQTTTGGQTSHLSGIALFHVSEDQKGRVRMACADNIRPRPTAELAPVFPTAPHALPEWIAVSTSGEKPSPTGKLPMQLGSLGDWFFPPLSGGAIGRGVGEGHSVARLGNDESFRYLGLLGKGWTPDRVARFEWDCTTRSIDFQTADVAHVRSFRRDDGKVEMSGSGSIQFDLNEGLMRRSVFQGQQVDHGVASTFSLSIDFLSTQQLREFARPSADQP